MRIAHHIFEAVEKHMSVRSVHYSVMESLASANQNDCFFSYDVYPRL
jgi:hypothetical protein